MFAVCVGTRSLPVRSANVGVVDGFHRNARPSVSGPLEVVGTILWICLIVGVVLKVKMIAFRLVGLEEVRDGLSTFNQDLNEIGGKLGVLITEERSGQAFISNTSSASCIQLELRAGRCS